jgi:hypothetical protein
MKYEALFHRPKQRIDGNQGRSRLDEYWIMAICECAIHDLCDCFVNGPRKEK